MYGEIRESSDQTIGKYIEQIMQKLGSNCQVCSEEMSQHSAEIYHGDGCVQIKSF
jgi:hypothetical protein